MRLHVRQAARAAGLAAALILSVCCGGGRPILPVPPIEDARTPEELRAYLDGLGGREDAEAWSCRARVYALLRELDEPHAADLMVRGDGADLRVLSGGAPPKLKSESAGRLARHFLLRTEDPSVARFRLGGALGATLGRVVLLEAAARFACTAGQDKELPALPRLQEAARDLAANEALTGEARVYWLRRVDRCGQLEEAGVRKFCETPAEEHLEEAVLAADAATREQATRGDATRAADGYLLALVHYAVARECLPEPTAAQAHALSGMEIVARRLEQLWTSPR